jgi:transcriptional regulator with PAS, ATPase and Fis domain
MAGGTRHSLANVERVVLARRATRTSERIVDIGVPTLVLGIPDRRISARHASLIREGSRFAVEDLGSRNGTIVNGRRPHGRLQLVDGDILQAGHTLMLYRAAVTAPLDAPADVDSLAFGDAIPLATLNASLVQSTERLVHIAKSAVPVLILGETGTGKELVARGIHRLSGRKGAFVSVNCGALTPSLLEAQLFGHVRGAFSGAVGDAPGLVRSADGGTLFLDEIGDLPGPAQAALLRALQEGEVTPVGAVHPIRVDLRTVAATHRPLEQLVAQEAFRGDLFARIAGFTFCIPPLRARREDIGVLVSALAAGRPLRCTPEAGYALLRYEWPFNVRELRHALEAAAALANGEAIGVAHLPVAVAEAASRPPPGADPVHERLIASLTRHRGNVSEVARELGKARMQVQRWTRRFGIDPRAFRRQ